MLPARITNWKTAAMSVGRSFEMKHPYADILIAIAEGKEVQFQTGNGTWLPQSVNATLYEIHHSQFGPGRYRIKPATININGVEVEGPVANGSYGLSIWPGMGERMNCYFTTPEARDAAYAALIKPFGEQA